MNWKTLLLLFVLLDFAIFSLYAITQVGYLGIWQAGFANWGSLQILADLMIAGGLICLWIFNDAPRHGMNPWSYIVITLVGGSFGPLLYLLRRQLRGATAVAETA